MNRSTARSQYRGQMSPEDIEAKVARLRERLGLEDVTFTEGVGLDAGSVSLRFQVLGRRVERTCATQPTPGPTWPASRSGSKTGRATWSGASSPSPRPSPTAWPSAARDNDAANAAPRVNHYEGSQGAWPSASRCFARAFAAAGGEPSAT
jgi:hypothetical protein